MDYSIVEYFGCSGGHECGYCKTDDTSLSNGMWAHSLTVEGYQNLIDRGWRRSGKYVYKPMMDKTCCPQYAISCDAQMFVLNKSHKKVLKKVNCFLNTGKRPSSTDHNEKCEEIDNQPDMRSSHGCVASTSHAQLEDIETVKIPNKVGSTGSSSTKDSVKLVAPGKFDVTVKAGSGADPDRGLCKKSKHLKREKWLEKHKNDPEAMKTFQEKNKPKCLDDFLKEVSNSPVHDLKIRLVRSSPRSSEFIDTMEESYEVYKKYQMVIHNDPAEKIEMKSWQRFLVDSPLDEEYKSDEWPAGYGSFHQQYILDGRIIAVGVVDILPQCVSSVYLYYDPDFHFLSIGTYSALREIAFVQDISTKDPAIKWYYLGYYIHSCPKMKYKGQYSPAYLVCPETYKWCAINECCPKLDTSKYARFGKVDDVDQNSNVELDNVMVLYKRQAMPYAVYKKMVKEKVQDHDEVLQYSCLIGKKCSGEILLYRS